MVCRVISHWYSASHLLRSLGGVTVIISLLAPASRSDDPLPLYFSVRCKWPKNPAEGDQYHLLRKVESALICMGAICKQKACPYVKRVSLCKISYRIPSSLTVVKRYTTECTMTSWFCGLTHRATGFLTHLKELSSLILTRDFASQPDYLQWL